MEKRTQGGKERGKSGEPHSPPHRVSVGLEKWGETHPLGRGFGDKGSFMFKGRMLWA